MVFILLMEIRAMLQKIGFDSEKFIKLEKTAILERISHLTGKLYMEMGGKIFDDLHASRVLPGYQPDNKIKILESLKDQLEIVICISAKDIEKNKIRADFGITYDLEVLRLIDNLKAIGLSVNSVCITLFNKQPSATKFAERLERRGEKVYYHYIIDGYPDNINKIVSEEGYGKNAYIETTKPLVVVAAPGPGSCKMATCLSQMYHESKMGLKSGYAKFETFPVHNLPLNHPVNIAYEAATADLQDRNMIDPYHLDEYGTEEVSYNRDIEAFPVLKNIFDRIQGDCMYKSPTDMGVNEVAKCIIDDEVCREAGRQEIIRRYIRSQTEYKKGYTSKTTINTIRNIMRAYGINENDRTVYRIAHEKQMEKNCHIVAIELTDGTLVTGKEQGVITATAGALLNALKGMANIPHDNIVDRESVKNLSDLKNSLNLGSSLDLKDIFIAMSILSSEHSDSAKAINVIPRLKGAEVHATYILPAADEDFLRKLQMNVTTDDVFPSDNLFE